jgi:hypothetical protein
MLSAFTLLDKTLPTTNAAYNQSMIMFRNPWGNDNYYSLTWNYKSDKWTDANIAQIPLGINPKLSQIQDGVAVMPISELKYCFDYYYIGHLRDNQGFAKNWFDQEKEPSEFSAKSYTWSPNKIVDTVYFSVENYPEKLITDGC